MISFESYSKAVTNRKRGRSRLWTKVTFVDKKSFVDKVVHKRYFVHKRYHIFVHKWFFVHKRYGWDFLIISVVDPVMTNNWVGYRTWKVKKILTSQIFFCSQICLTNWKPYWSNKDKILFSSKSKKRFY